MDSAIRLVGVTKSFPGSATPAVDHLDLDLPAGAITVLVGPSGCGKTTVLRMINRLVEPTSGQILIDGVDVGDGPAHLLRRRIGYVIQHGGLFPHRTVADNIATVPRLEGWPASRVDARVAELAELVGLGPELLDRYPAALSGGQRQRVSIARALAIEPSVIFMDEPFSTLDEVTARVMRQHLSNLHQADPKTTLFVTHSIREAIYLSDVIVILTRGPATVLETVEVPFARPRSYEDPKLAEFERHIVDRVLDVWGETEE